MWQVGVLHSFSVMLKPVLISNHVLALGNPLNSLTPTTQFGEIIDIVMATWSLVLASTVMGMIGGLHAAETFANKMQGSMAQAVEEIKESFKEKKTLKMVSGWAPVSLVSYSVERFTPL
jgi:hypothetical protein